MCVGGGRGQGGRRRVRKGMTESMSMREGDEQIVSHNWRWF